MKRFSIPAFILLLSLLDSSQAGVLLFDEFTDSDRTENPAWYSLTSRIRQSGGVLSVGGNANGHRYLISNFREVTLAVGDKLTLSFRVKMTLSSTQSRDREVVFAIGNNRGTLVTSDGAEAANYEDDLGYMAALGLGTGISAIGRDNGTLSFLGRAWQDADHTQLGGDISAKRGMNPTAVFRDYILTLERSARGMDIVLSAGDTSVSASDHAVPGHDFHTFNMLAIGFYNRGDDNTLDVDRISLTHTAGSAHAASHPASGRVAPAVIAFQEERVQAPFDALAIEIQVERLGDAAGELRAGLRTRDGSARGHTDFVPVDTELVWARGDRNPQTIRITPRDNSAARGKHFLLELHSPGPGVHLGTRQQIRVELY